MLKRVTLVTIAAGILTLTVLNILLWQSAWIGVIAGGLWLIGTSMLAGKLFGGTSLWERISLGVLITICLIILSGSASFYLSYFTDFHAALITLFLPVIFLWIDWNRDESTIKEWLTQKNKKSRNQEINIVYKHSLTWLKTHWLRLMLMLMYAVLYALAITTILNHQTDQAIRSPWEVLPRSLLIVYGLLTFTLLLLLFHIRRGSEAWPHAKASRRLRGHGSDITSESEAESRAVIPSQGELTVSFAADKLSILLTLHFFLSFSLVLLIYRIGFGFDPFVHRATESILADTGAISPKPYLYVGQYTLVVFLSRLLSLPLALIDKWLLPILASILLPSLIHFSLQKTFPVRAMSEVPYLLHLTILSLLILPVYFIVTIPQPFANLLYLILIFLSFPYLSGRSVPLSLLWGLGVAIFFVHALTGIPALLYLFLLTILSRPAFRFRTTMMLLTPLLGAIAIPGLVALGSMLNGNGIQTAGASLPFPALAPHYLPFLSLAHTAELWHRALPLLFFLAAIAGTYLLWKHGRRGLTIVPWLTALSLAGSYFLVRNVNLSAIIAYERAEFTERILELIGITLLPFFLYFLLHLFTTVIKDGMAWISPRGLLERVLNSKGRLRMGTVQDGVEGTRVPEQEIHAIRPLNLIIILSCLITVSFYYAYPRVDAFAKNRGYSVSQSDIDAVHWIEKDAGDGPYIVLSNQSVAAAALQELGFKQYFNTPQGALFYYPIPTSSPLYQYYLDMVYKEASRTTMLNAMEVTGVSRAYFVLNDYWLDADKIATRALTDSDAQMTIGVTRIFTYIQH